MSELALVVENKLETMGKVAVLQARSLTISTNEQYEDASRLLIDNKRMVKSIKDYWDEPKGAAKAAHQSIVDKEKAMLEPLLDAEKIIKGAMLIYERAVEQVRYKAEVEAKKRQQEESERLLKEAIASEAKGDDASAAVSMAMSEMIEDMKPVAAWIEPPKANGISSRKVWKARIINAELVPVCVNGIEVRPISMSALDNLARMTRGSIVIPGVELYEETIMSARV